MGLTSIAPLKGRFLPKTSLNGLFIALFYPFRVPLGLFRTRIIPFYLVEILLNSNPLRGCHSGCHSVIQVVIG